MTTAIRGVTGPRFVSDVVAAACGNWPELLAAVGIDTPSRGKHGPCPVCGGSDRFRLDDKGGRGTWICNQCGAGDGLDLVSKVTGKPPKEVAELLTTLTGTEIDKKKVELPSAIKEFGSYDASVRLYAGVVAPFKLKVEEL